MIVAGARRSRAIWPSLRRSSASRLSLRLLGDLRGYAGAAFLVACSTSGPDCDRADTCSETESIFDLWGAPQLMIASSCRFGATVAPPIAARSSSAWCVPSKRGGAALWSGAAVASAWCSTHRWRRSLWLTDMGLVVGARDRRSRGRYIASSGWNVVLLRILRMGRLATHQLNAMMGNRRPGRSSSTCDPGGAQARSFADDPGHWSRHGRPGAGPTSAGPRRVMRTVRTQRSERGAWRAAMLRTRADKRGAVIGGWMPGSRRQGHRDFGVPPG